MTDGIDALCAALRSAGIDVVFGLPGTQTVPLFEGLRRARLRTVLASHELAASFMANGYFRATGRIAALSTIPGPGFTYALTGLAEARLDSVGLLFLVGTPAANPGRRFQLQSIDQRAIAEPLVKASFRINRPEDASRVTAEACAAARGGEPGPVMLELDVAALEGDVDDAVTQSDLAAEADAGAVDSLVDALRLAFDSARRPIFLLGQGALESATQLGAIAQAVSVPIVTTPSARGIVPEDEPLVLGFDPLRGHVDELNAFLAKADLVLGLGCKLGHNGSAGFGLQLVRERFMHVDASPEVLGANYDARLCVPTRVERVVTALTARRTSSDWRREEILDAKRAMRAMRPGDVEPTIRGRSAMKPGEFFAWLRANLARDAIVVLDSGLHQILARRHLDVLSPRGLSFPSDFQSMGFGLPAAIGAKLGAPERPLVAIVGDGGFLMSGLELLSARREGVPLTVFVFNDGHLNQIRMQQHANYGHSHAVDLLNPDYAALAVGMGVRYLAFEDAKPGELAAALAGDDTVLIEVKVGDSLAMTTDRITAGAKDLARRALGPRVRAWLRPGRRSR